MRADFALSDLSVLRRVMEVNFYGSLHMTYYAIPYVKQTHGSLVAISSLTGKRGVPTYAMYSASKFAVQGLYESLRVELASAGVHVGILAPAFVDTPLREAVLGADGKPLAAPSDFRLWPVEKCVDSLIRLIVRRQRQATLPWFIGPVLALDDLTNGWAGVAIWVLGNFGRVSRLAVSPASSSGARGLNRNNARGSRLNRKQVRNHACRTSSGMWPSWRRRG